MDYLREGIHLRGFAQIDPLVAYKNEGFGMFEALMYSIWEEFARLIFHVEVEVAPRAQEQFGGPERPAAIEYSGGTAEQPSALGQAAVATASGADVAAEQAIEGTAQAARAGRQRRRHRPDHGRQGRQGEDRPQRPLLVRLGQEVQEVPRRLISPG